MALDLSFDRGSPLDISDEHNISNIISMLESPSSGVEDCLPDTEPVRILEGVVACVEVRSKNENRSVAVSHELRKMGAQVVNKLTPDVTHVIWKEGKPSTRDRAKKRGIPVVSVLWVASCKQNKERVPESLFGVSDSSAKNTPVLVGKLKKSKSMQPNDFESDVANSADRGIKKRKRQNNADRFKMLQTPKPGTPAGTPRYLVAETQPRTPLSFCSPNVTVPDTPPSMRARLNSLKAREAQQNSSKGAETTQTKEQENMLFSPLTTKPGVSPTGIQKRLFVSPIRSPVSDQEQSSKTSESELDTSGPVATTSRTVNVKSSTGSKSSENSSIQSTSSSAEPVIKKTSKKRKLLALNEDPTPELLQPTISSQAGQTKPSILNFGPKKGGKAKKVTYQPIEENPSKKRKMNSGNSKEDSKVTGPGLNCDTTMGSSLSSQDSTDDSMNVTVVKKARRKSVAVCQTPVESPSQVVRKSRRKSIAVVTSQSTEEIADRASEDKLNDRNGSVQSEPKPKVNRRRSMRISSIGSSQPLVSSQIATPDISQVPKRETKLQREIHNKKSLNSSVKESTDDETDRIKQKHPEKKQNEQPQGASSQSSTCVSQLSLTDTDGESKKKRLDKRKWIKQVISESSDNSSQEDTPTIVMTSLHSDEQEIVLSVVKRLGGFRVVNKITSQTTHVVCGNNRRTLNVLHAIARGCWLVSLEWVYKSLEAGTWMGEADYEQSDFFPAILESRSLRERGHSNNLFKNSGAIYVSDQSKPPKPQLEQLLSLCGGQVVASARKASLCVGPVAKPDLQTVPELWILDSITAFKALPVQECLLKSSPKFREPSPDY